MAEVNIESGVERQLTTQKFRDITSMRWLPDPVGLLIAASRIPSNSYSRIWQVSAVTGEVSPLTGESENYTALSADRTARLIVVRQTKADFKLFLYHRENPLDKQMMVNATRVEFAPNGKILFASPMSGSGEIWSINADGSEQRQLTNDAADDSMPVSSPDNHSIFFVSNRTGQAQVWRMNADGSNQTQITFKDGGFPIFVSPDGLWVYYQSSLLRSLWRIATKGGGEPELVLNKAKPHWAFSRDGLWLAFSESQGGVKSLIVTALADGRTVKTIAYPDQHASMAELDWLPDGKSVAYILENADFGNHTLWLQSLAEKTPKKIAELGNEEVTSFAVSPDGRTFATVQGVWKNNMILLRSVK
jgi:WD40 repeat protein